MKSLPSDHDKSAYLISVPIFSRDYVNYRIFSLGRSAYNRSKSQMCKIDNLKVLRRSIDQLTEVKIKTNYPRCKAAHHQY